MIRVKIKKTGQTGLVKASRINEETNEMMYLIVNSKNKVINDNAGWKMYFTKSEIDILDSPKVIEQIDIDNMVQAFVGHRVWMKVALAYTVSPLWTIEELIKHCDLPASTNILANANARLKQLGYHLVSVNPKSRGSKYYLKKITSK